MRFQDLASTIPELNDVNPEALELLKNFFKFYTQAIADHHPNPKEHMAIVHTYLKQVVQQIFSKTEFGHYHESMHSPIDYFSLGLELVAPLVDQKKSKLLGLENLDRIEQQLSKGENVILLSNHQTETDPHLILFALLKNYPLIASRMVFVAGHRVTQDILAIPFSLGLNLLCIYSKKYIDYPPDLKSEKIMHNQKTMKEMKNLLGHGGVCIFVACSGGRDRKKSDGTLSPDPFDPQSVELFYLISKQTNTPTHFYPLSMSTYAILPPPDEVHYKLGEPRHFSFSPAHFYYGKELKMEELCSEIIDRKEKRIERSNRIHAIVLQNYQELTHD